MITTKQTSSLLSVIDIAGGWLGYVRARQTEADIKNQQRWANIEATFAQDKANEEYLARAAESTASYYRTFNPTLNGVNSANFAAEKLQSLRELEKEKRMIRLNAESAMAAQGVMAAEAAFDGAVGLVESSAKSYFGEYKRRKEMEKNDPIDYTTEGMEEQRPVTDFLTGELEIRYGNGDIVKTVKNQKRLTTKVGE